MHGIFQARILEWGAIAFSDATWEAQINYTSVKKTKDGCYKKMAALATLQVHIILQQDTNGHILPDQVNPLESTSHS